MRIIYTTIYDATDVHHWSGTGYHIARAIRQQNINVDLLGPLPGPRLTWPVFKAKGLLYNRILRKRYHRAHDVALARHYARKIENRLPDFPNGDLIFSPWAVPVAFLKTDLPIVYWHDATHGQLFDFYPEYTNLCRRSIRDGHQVEQAALNRAAAAIFSSEWAAESAIRDYGADPAKVHVVPFGANLESPPSAESVSKAIESRSRKICQLLFFGVDWKRKGGDLALKVAKTLNESGVPTELTIVGCEPPNPENLPSFVRREGFLSKRNPAELNRIEQLLKESHFLIVPSLAECFGIVYCEANAFGLPCLARSVGGVPTAINNGKNGFLFDPVEPAFSYAQTIRYFFRNYPAYAELAQSSRNEFEQRLNWQTAGAKIRKILSGIIGEDFRKRNQNRYKPAVLQG